MQRQPRKLRTALLLFLALNLISVNTRYGGTGRGEGGNVTGITVAVNDEPLPIMFSPWKPVIDETKKISSSCPDFMFYSVSVQSARAENHHFSSVASPNVTIPNCAVLLVLRTNSINKTASDVVTKFQRSEDRYASLGWEVIATNHELPAILARRISRLPKLNPVVFFPHTAVVLYSDMKLLSKLSPYHADSIAQKLLAGTLFGIVQHPKSGSLEAERKAIEVAKTHRPNILDSVELLNTQVGLLTSVLDSNEQEAFGIEGQVHAHDLKKDGGSKLFDGIWLEEYLHGADRDQISFYAAATRIRMKREIPHFCDKFNRSGIYRSGYDARFSFAIHCNLKSLGILKG